ncbi:MAG: tyrosine-protein phosphatase [Gammaproteobacteria bacterium]|nr:tyrosine-protein phosphatase [Gammaproteobacteria bacterium]
MRTISTIVLLFITLTAFAEPRVRPDTWAAPVIGTDQKNLYQINKGLFRSEQPEREDTDKLQALGIKEVLNLREFHSDKREFRKTTITLHHLKINTDNLNETDLINSLRIIKNKKGPLLVHCWHGSDRTGTVVAAYRIIFDNWSKQQALDEMINGGYGYHASLYQNLVTLINEVDVNKIKKALQIPL